MSSCALVLPSPPALLRETEGGPPPLLPTTSSAGNGSHPRPERITVIACYRFMTYVDRSPRNPAGQPLIVNDFARKNASTGFVSSTTSLGTSSTYARTTTSIERQPSPYVMRHGRRYLNDPSLHYPLPCDVAEIHRQNLRTVLLTEVFGGPLCAPALAKTAPKKVLEIACGSGFWSSLCHDYFASRGFPDVAFTGLDIAPLAPDLGASGMNWSFVQHDLRRLPLPFRDDEFDLVFVKDMSLVVTAGDLQDQLMDDYLRVLRPGGILEAWECDHTLRSLVPHPVTTTGVSKTDQQRAQRLGVYPLGPSTPCTTPPNDFLQDYNAWLRETLAARHLTPTPCAAMGSLMLQEAEDLVDQGSRRFAILLSDVKWEREGVGGRQPANSASKRRQSRSHASGNAKYAPTEKRTLKPDQVALRRTALLAVVQMMESLEPLLKEASGKGPDEWDRWWSGMMEDLFAKKGTASGECLEVGAWWGRML
ncbi:MAG: hypothetical protein M1817_002760 [Caeruleum heppii]|nr:MAG: hypothetical protein M1817_002760 [Caeruleum heppii]